MRTALSLSLIPPAQNRRSGADRTLATGGRTIVKGDILSWGCRWRGSPVTMAYEFVDPAWPLPLRHDDGLAFGLQPAITPRTVRSEMFAFRAIVAADGQQPVPSWREHAPAGARRTRRSLPEVESSPAPGSLPRCSSRSPCPAAGRGPAAGCPILGAKWERKDAGRRVQ